jgi:hypothetical protein
MQSLATTERSHDVPPARLYFLEAGSGEWKMEGQAIYFIIQPAHHHE